MVEALTQYLYQKSMFRYIEGYVQKVNPQKAPQVGLVLCLCVSGAFCVWWWGWRGGRACKLS